MIRVITIAWTVWLEMIRRKDFYVLLILLVALLFLLLSINIFGLGGMVRYVADVGLMFAWLFSVILAVSLAGRQLPQEEAKGTIYPLLAKPITRMELLLGKWLGAWTGSAAATALFYAVVFAVVVLRGGAVAWATLGQALLLHGAFLAVINALALAISTRQSYGAAATLSYVLTGAGFVLAPRVPELVSNGQGFSESALMFLYYALPHLELFDLRQRVVHDVWGPAPWPVVLAVFGYGIVWTLVLVLLAWFGYRQKRFKRGALG
jgi:Cu-processing system permease protein